MINSNNQYSVIIVEDETPSREILKKNLSEFPEFKLQNIARNGKDALQILNENKYDLLFLDINLPLMSGLEVLDNLKKDLPYIIFVTGYDKYAMKAFEIGAIDYLLKPYTKERFRQSINRFISFKKENKRYDLNYEKHCLPFKENRTQCLVAFNDIIYISSHGKHTVVHTEEKDFDSATLMKDIESKLIPDMFMRIHKQYIINIYYITKLKSSSGGRYIAILKDSDENALPVGRIFMQPLKKKLEVLLKTN